MLKFKIESCYNKKVVDIYLLLTKTKPCYNLKNLNLQKLVNFYGTKEWI